MKNDANRWIAAISLLSLFAIIACAGTRSSVARQAAQNVLVTNSSSQPIPIAARPGTGAYIVSVANAPSVKVLSSPTAPVTVKDVNNPDVNGAFVSDSFVMLPSITFLQTVQLHLSSVPAVIDSVSLDGLSSVAGESIDSGDVSVLDQSASFVGGAHFIIPAVQNGLYSAYVGTVHLPIPTNGLVVLSARRHGGVTNGCSVSYSIAYHTVPKP